MQADVRTALERMAAAVEEAQSYLQDVGSLEDWLESRLRQRAVERCLIMLGEEAFQLTKLPEEELPPLPVHALAALRHRLVHDYLRIDATTLYRHVQDDLPALLASLQALLEPER